MADKLKQPQQQQQQNSSFLQVPDNNNNNNNLSRRQQQQQQAIQKKHSGPLDEALAELNRQEVKQQQQQQQHEIKHEDKTTTTTTTTATSDNDYNDYDNDDDDDDDKDACNNNNKIKQQQHKTTRRLSLIKDAHHYPHYPHYANHHYHHHNHHHGAGGGGGSCTRKQRERWLLTRKTWKFMQDAGKKLLPDGIKNTKDDIPLIEENFQRVCANETRFILWRRKCSFPGALRTNRLRPIALHRQQQHKVLTLPKSLDGTADETIELLKTYLRYIDNDPAGGGGGYAGFATTALISSKTQQPHQTISPSSQRPTNLNNNQNNQLVEQLELLLKRLRVLSAQLNENQNNSNEFLPMPEFLTHDYLIKNKMQLRQFYNALKRQQLHRQNPMKRHNNNNNTTTTAMPYRTLSMGNLNHYTNQRNSNINKNAIDESQLKSVTAKRQILPPQTLNLSSTTPPAAATTTTTTTSGGTTTTTTTTAATNLNKKKPAAKQRLYYNSCGTQTSFIPLQEIKQLALEYKQNQLDNNVNKSAIDDATTTTATVATTTTTTTMRKSSLDNSDVSPTVSDTIKRYLRMARKKSLTGGTGTTPNASEMDKLKKEKEKKANFQRINYDRQLRMIRARGEINPPGMDEDNSKATQTLDAWPLIMLDFIRNNSSDNLDLAHNEWDQQLQQRLQRKLDYELKFQQQQQQHDNNKKSPTENYNLNYYYNNDDRDDEFSSSATISPTSPPPHQIHNNSSSSNSGGGLLSGTTQFLSNLWHGNNYNNNNNNNNNLTTTAANSDNNINKSKFSPLFSKHCKYTTL